MKPNRRRAVIYESYHSVLAIRIASIVPVAALICEVRSVTRAWAPS